MPTTRKPDSDSRKSESESKKSEAQNPRRESVSGTPSGTEQTQTEMKKFMREIRGMFTELKNEVAGVNERFSDIISELRSDINEIQTEVAQVNKKVQDLERQVGDIDKSMSYHADKVYEIEKQQDEQYEELKAVMEEKMEMMNKKLLMMEKHGRKYNLIFHGIEEERSEKLYDKMRAFFVSHLKIEENRAENIVFHNGHRMPTKAVGVPKPIIMRFVYYEDRDLILSNAHHLARTGKRILTDLPKTMKDERARLAKEAYQIRQKETLKTRIREIGLDIILEVKKHDADKWVQRKV